MERISLLLKQAGDPKKLWRRFVVAMLIILALFATSHVSGTMALGAGAKNASLINESGRQRMLSQRILFLSSQMTQEYTLELENQLTAAIDLFASSHARLTSSEKLSPDLKSIYGSGRNLDQRVQTYVDLARRVASNSSGQAAAWAEILAFDRDALLRDLDLAVAGFEAIADADRARMKTIQDVTFYAAILVILIEGIAIFLPAQLIVTRSIDRLEAQSKALSKAQVIAVARNKELESLRKALEHEALHDALTGLPNRRSLEQTLKKLETSSDTLSAMHIDLDRFKAINDTLGHAAGDYILKHVAKTLRACASEDDIIARVGGDEFVILPKTGSTIMDLKALSERIIKEMAKPVHYEESICQFGASIGICIGISQGETRADDPRDLLVRADVALYKAKELGRGRYEFFSDELSERVEAAKLNANELLLAFERNEFTVHYQPIFHAKSRTISSLEALVRWEHPTYGLKTAGSFIDDVKKLGLGLELDCLVLSEIENHVRTAAQEGIELPRIAMNVTAKSLIATNFIDRVVKSPLCKSGFALEVSESVDFESHMEEVQNKLSRARDAGIDIEIDDFGTGHASIFSFQKIQPNRVKIAREVLLDVERSQETRQTLRAICQLAQSFSADTVAEGIENTAMADTIHLMGCDYMQGFGLSRPKSFEQLLFELSLAERPERAPKTA